MTSGAIGLVVGHPLDTVKVGHIDCTHVKNTTLTLNLMLFVSLFGLQVRLQTQSVYSGIYDCVLKTYTHEGVSL